MRATAAVLVAVITLMGMVTPASASSNRVEVSGVAVPANPGECDPDADLALMMSGDLAGCWNIFVERSSCRERGRADRYREVGAETFDGTVKTGNGDATGTFNTRYVFRASMSKGTDCNFDLQRTGGCVHWLRGRGTGDLERTSGVIRFTDNIPNVPGPAVSFSYEGTLRRVG